MQRSKWSYVSLFNYERDIDHHDDRSSEDVEQHVLCRARAAEHVPSWAVFFRETRIACRCLEDRLCVRGVRISSAGAVWPEEKRSMMMIPSPSTLQRWSTSAPGRAARAPESRVCNARLGSARGGRLRGSGACFLAFPLWSRSGRALVALWSRSGRSTVGCLPIVRSPAPRVSFLSAGIHPVSPHAMVCRWP